MRTRTPLAKPRALLEGLTRRIYLLGAETGGLAAVEFALILPLMLAMYFGVTEVSFGVAMDRKLTLLTRSLADLTGRVQTIATADMANIFAAATSVMKPYDSSKLQMVVTSVVIPTGATQGKVDWSCAKNTPAALPAGAPRMLAARAKDSIYAIPAGFETSKSFILVETMIPYMPMFGYSFTGTIWLNETTPWPVRNVTQVTGPSPCPT